MLNGMEGNFQPEFPELLSKSENRYDDQEVMEPPRVICRYGRGCTHTDIGHLEGFWHPPSQEVTDDEYHTHYICNECGASCTELDELQLHLRRKTAWSDNSLVGCRISCLIENKEWHEGYVSAFSQNGKHLIEFLSIGEKRWLNMKRIAFYIAERPPNRHTQTENSEYKDDLVALIESDGLAPIEDMENWVYVEDISLEYTFAQSVLYKVFNNGVQETGHKTKGHSCLTDGDKNNAKFSKGSLLYGELLPRGANKAFGPARLNAENAKVLYDLGMGTGKIPMQAFLQYPMEYVYGVELSQGRYNVAEEAALNMVSLLGAESFHVQIEPGRFIIVTEKSNDGTNTNCRVLHFECGNLFDTCNMHKADIVMLETDIPSSSYSQFCHFMNQLKVGARTLSYLDINKIWDFQPFTFKQLDVNKRLSDRFPTSWSVQRGHHFFIWKKTQASEITPLPAYAIGFDSSGSPQRGHKSRKRHGHRAHEDDSGAASEGACLPSLGLFSAFTYMTGLGGIKNQSVIPRATFSADTGNNTASTDGIEGSQFSTRASATSTTDTDATLESELESIGSPGFGSSKQRAAPLPMNSPSPSLHKMEVKPPRPQSGSRPSSASLRQRLNNSESASSPTSTTNHDRTTPRGDPPPTPGDQNKFRVDTNEVATTSDSMEPAFPAEVHGKKPWEQGRSPAGADSDTMNTPQHLKSAGPSKTDGEGSIRAEMIAKNANLILALPADQQEQTVLDSSLSPEAEAEGAMQASTSHDRPVFVESMRSWNSRSVTTDTINSITGESDASSVGQNKVSVSADHASMRETLTDPVQFHRSQVYPSGAARPYEEDEDSGEGCIIA